MRAISLIACLSACGTQLVDPCAGVKGTCLALQIDPSPGIAKVDDLIVHVDGYPDQHPTSAGTTHTLPVAIGLSFSDVTVDTTIDLKVTGLLQQMIVGSATAQPMLHGGRHETIHLQLSNGQGDLGTGDGSNNNGDGSESGDGATNHDLGGDAALANALTITPDNQTISGPAGAPLPAVVYSATLGGQKVAASWTIDGTALGSFDASGNFTPSGTVGGASTIHASYNGLGGSTMVTVALTLTQNGDPNYMPSPSPSPLPLVSGFGAVGGNGPGAPATSAQQATLASSPGTDSAVKILYPYDGTVWPQGLAAPLIQWNPNTHNFDSISIHIQENGFDYQGTFGPPRGGAPFINLPIPQAAWSAIAGSNGGEPVTVTIIFGQGANAVGPYTLSWHFASDRLKSLIYYTAYGTKLVVDSDSPDLQGQYYGAATVSLKPGDQAPRLVASNNTPGSGVGCVVCHSVSSGGQRMVAQRSNASASDYGETDLVDPTTGGTTKVGTNLAFSALTPDGNFLFAGAGTENSANSSALFTMPSASPVATTGLVSSSVAAAFPTFSPDGAHVAFNFHSGLLDSTAADQVSLVTLDFDGTATFSGAQLLYKPVSTMTPVVWPSYTPDSKSVLFEIQLSNPSGNLGYTWNHDTGELWWVDVASKSAHRLDQLNGVGLPDDGNVHNHGPGVDATLNYLPSVCTTVSGGYAWVVFTSRRLYGNVATVDPWQSDPRNTNFNQVITTKKLWVAAIDLSATPNTDRSHPAFYLPGQELFAANGHPACAVGP